MMNIYDNSHLNIGEGTSLNVGVIYAYNDSTLSIAGGSARSIEALDTSDVQVLNGSASMITAWDTSNIPTFIPSELDPYYNSNVDLHFTVFAIFALIYVSIL